MSSLLKNPFKQNKEVMLLNPEDNRFTTLKVERETESILYCKKHDGILYRFFKHGPGWTEKMVRFFAVEGTPLISYTKNHDIKTATDMISFIKLSLGEDNFKKLEPSIKQRLEERCIGATVTIDPYEPNDKTRAIFNEVKAESILFDSDLENTANLGKSVEIKKWADKMFDKLPWILTGFGLDYILQALGVF